MKRTLVSFVIAFSSLLPAQVANAQTEDPAITYDDDQGLCVGSETAGVGGCTGSIEAVDEFKVARYVVETSEGESTVLVPDADDDIPVPDDNGEPGFGVPGYEELPAVGGDVPPVPLVEQLLRMSRPSWNFERRPSVRLRNPITHL